MTLHKYCDRCGRELMSEEKKYLDGLCSKCETWLIRKFTKEENNEVENILSTQKETL